MLINKCLEIMLFSAYLRKILMSPIWKFQSYAFIQYDMGFYNVEMNIIIVITNDTM